MPERILSDNVSITLSDEAPDVTKILFRAGVSAPPLRPLIALHRRDACRFFFPF